MKRLLSVLALSFFIASFFCSAGTDVQLRFPVRVIEGENKSFKLGKDDFQLLINDSQREIARLIKREQSIAGNSDLRKNFILSFHTAQFSEPIVNAVSYFVTEIVNSEDSLIILTPLNAYRIMVSRNKQKMIMDIEDLLKKDSTVHKKNRMFSERKLESELNKMRIVLSDLSSSDDIFLISSYKTVFQFLKSFAQEFSDFKNHFLLPDVDKYQQIADLLGRREGEKWWIHFQHRESNDILPRIKGILNKVNTYISYQERNAQSLARAMRRDLSYLEKQLILSDLFPAEKLSNIILRSYISYNTIYWGSLKSSEPSTFRDEASDLEGQFNKISNYSGGKTVITTQPEQGLREIEKNQDHYYELLFDFNGKLEEKRVHVSVKGKKMKLSYIDKISREEIESLVQYYAEGKVKIGEFSINENQISFAIKSFTRKKEKDQEYGLLKVRISLLDEQNVNVYKSENIMRASKDRITISLPVPQSHHGKYKFVISVYDLIANNSTSDEHPVTLR